MNPFISAILSITILTFAGSLTSPGTGDRYGPSVSVVIWLMLTMSAIIWNSWLRTMFVGIEKLNPASAAVFIRFFLPSKQCNTTFFSLLLVSMSIASFSALLVWTIIGFFIFSTNAIIFSKLSLSFFCFSGSFTQW